ncbi:MAG: carbonic anhydrase [Chromatiales bacterium]|nr:carbonic anhydrase [Chromatiales bacterium]
MKKTALALLMLGFTSAEAGTGTAWGYSGAEGPEHWGSLSPAYSACSTGKNQSPVNISDAVETELPELGMDYKSGGTSVLNNGHTIQVNYAPGSQLEVNGRPYTLKQFHFHSPSENTIDGKSFPLEAHLVHADAAGNLAVVAVMFEEGAENPTLKQIWSQMPHEAHETAEMAHSVDAASLLPSDRGYYRFSGSLTTPPCSEGVTWLVMKHYDTASKRQIEKFEEVMHHPNNRPVQAVNARLIMQ